MKDILTGQHHFGLNCYGLSDFVKEFSLTLIYKVFVGET